jgi:hypothetical protein
MHLIMYAHSKYKNAINVFDITLTLSYSVIFGYCFLPMLDESFHLQCHATAPKLGCDQRDIRCHISHYNVDYLSSA